MHFLTMFLRITFKILLCCRVSLEMFNGRSAESTTPLTKLRYSGMSSSQLSMMNTRRTYNLMLFLFFLFSNRSNGARLARTKARGTLVVPQLRSALQQDGLPSRWSNSCRILHTHRLKCRQSCESKEAWSC